MQIKEMLQTQVILVIFCQRNVNSVYVRVWIHL